MKGVYFISGIDTDIGKTLATGLIARKLQAEGVNLITQKLVQTGNNGYSEDLEKHRAMMQSQDSQPPKPFPEDAQGLTAPAIFTHPCSPHLAAKIDKKTLDLTHISQATASLASRYEVVLLEGAGGLMVPLTETCLTIDYIAQQQYPVMLVTSSRLGSINHTLLSLMALTHYQLTLDTLIFNAHHDQADALIAKDTKRYLKNAVKTRFPEANWWEMPANAE